jgi:hypothetical protein
MTHGRGKSDEAIVAVKPANAVGATVAEQSAAAATVEELAERRAEAKGNANQQSTRRTQSRISVTQAQERIGRAVDTCLRHAVTYPRWEPYAGNPHVRICAGGAR